jgi:hypothetical protein
VVNAAHSSLETKRCAPCEFQASPTLRFAVTFEPDAQNTVSRIEVRPLAGGQAAPQVLEIKDYGRSFSGAFALVGMDLDFDGILDLAFGPITDTPNEMLNYWRVDPQGNRLEALGVFANLQVDAATRSLRSHEKGGHAGLLFESRTYRWQNHQLMLIEAVSQTQEPGQAAYRETTTTYEAGRAVAVKTRRVPAP